jgi:hypothetical protein
MWQTQMDSNFISSDRYNGVACGGDLMSSIRDDLHSFQKFVEERLAGKDVSASLDELFMQWHDRQSRSEINDAIRQGLADIEAGRFLPADEAMEKIRQQFGFAKE